MIFANVFAVCSMWGAISVNSPDAPQPDDFALLAIL
jgi:hypothetical protein